MKHLLPFCAASLLALCSLGLADKTASGTTQAAGFVNWPSHNGAADENAYSGLDQINTTNVGKLGLAWFLDLGDERMLEGTPLAVDGMLYFTGSYSKVYAVDATSGKLRWSYDPQDWRRNPAKFRFALPVNRGVAYADGRVFAATIDGRLIALDAKTGHLLWSVDAVPLYSMQTITGAPRVFRGKVLIGNGGGDFGERGYLAAHDTATGRELWRFNAVPGTPQEIRGDPAMQRAAATWVDAKPAGGAPWDGITIDPELNRIYVGTGNPSPNASSERGPAGDNLYTCSIVALDADTGKYIWHYQVTPRDAWDFDAAEQMTLADLVIDGTRRKVLMQAPKNGFFYVLDRVSGKLISAEKLGKANWAERIDLATGRPVDTKNNRYETGDVAIWPTGHGAHDWQAMSFSPQTGLVYVPYMQLGVLYKKSAGKGAYGGLQITVVKADPMDGKSALIAWDPIAEKARWKVQHNDIFNGGTLATGGRLVFQGAADGFLTAYDALTGERLWRFNAGLGIISAPISYSISGRQYVSVLVGYGATNIMGVTNVGWKFGAQPRRLLTFALGGKTALPPSAPQDFVIHAVDDPSVKLDEAQVHQGNALFNGNCGGCHGLDAVSAGAPAPDLRESHAALSRANLWSIVHDGTLVPLGMPPFADLDAAQVGEIHAYIRARAREALGIRPKVMEKQAAPAHPG